MYVIRTYYCSNLQGNFGPHGQARILHWYVVVVVALLKEQEWLHLWSECQRDRREPEKHATANVTFDCVNAQRVLLFGYRHCRFPFVSHSITVSLFVPNRLTHTHTHNSRLHHRQGRGHFRRQ